MDDQKRVDYLRLQAGITDPKQQMLLLDDINPRAWARTEYDPSGVGVMDYVMATPVHPLFPWYYGAQAAHGQLPRHPLMRQFPALDPWASR